jgi:hypothetical protein
VTPALFDLPLRLGDAAALADILIDRPASALRKPLTDEIRSRLAARVRSANFECMTPLMPSLERDPVHPSAWYVCVDGVEKQPLLLRVAPATTPSSGLFPKAILIGRTFAGTQEVVLNAVSFGAEDHDRILAFSEHVNTAFQPKPFGSHPVIRVSGKVPAEAFPAAFEAFPGLLRSSGLSRAAFGLMEGQDATSFYFATVWAAIRAGWREGYTLHSPAPVPPIQGVRGRPFEAGGSFGVAFNIAREIVIDDPHLRQL